MPNVKGAAVAVIGQILSIDKVTKYDNEAKKATDIFDGAKIMVGTQDGFAVVKVDAEQYAALQPVVMRGFAGLVRYGAWSGRSNQGEETCRFIEPIGQNWVDFLNSTLGGLKAQQPKAA